MWLMRTYIAQDKLRLVFHWRIDASFRGGARLHFKGILFHYASTNLTFFSGSRDPYHVIGIGAGFDFCWDGNVAIKVGHPNKEKELIQLTSDSMMVTIPKCVITVTPVLPCKSNNRRSHKYVQDGSIIGNLSEPSSGRQAKKDSSASACDSENDRKVCAKFRNGIRLGVGITLERTCGMECNKCQGDDFSRDCRFFTFIPHHQVILHTVDRNPNPVSFCYFIVPEDYLSTPL